ncbi:calcium-transporting ATPase 7, plasma membrane-type-like [Miscanthus floridulus]|uniref:calcium-transporting ATPase 7, plasma membrane-type-like n=1 Tax=Miscanthus floridulus TaxID=154761 RepID=UPI0034578509
MDTMGVQAAFQVVVLLVLQYRGREIFGVSEKANGTMIFNAFVLCQVFNEFNAQEIERRKVLAGVLGNKMFQGIIAVKFIPVPDRPLREILATRRTSTAAESSYSRRSRRTSAAVASAPPSAPPSMESTQTRPVEHATPPSSCSGRSWR